MKIYLKVIQRINFILYITFCSFILLIIYSCKSYTRDEKLAVRQTYKDINEILHLAEKPFLKAHLKNGDVYLFMNRWSIDTGTNIILGPGYVYDYNRKLKEKGPLTLNIDSVAILETNNVLNSLEADKIAALTIFSALDAVLGIICITNPKACFGSCPTFYMEDNNFHYADAEGFSNAIAPSLEYYDIDALNNPPTYADSFSLLMKNEALETHCINKLKLLAYPRKEKERIYQSKTNEFYSCSKEYPLQSAMAMEGDIRLLLNDEDKNERFSLSDPKNLNSKEEIVLTFDSLDLDANLGLKVNFRQTLMTTYLIYNGISYMGDQVSDIFAKVEASSEVNNKLKNGIKKILGDIDVYVWNEKEGQWIAQGGFNETGPIAFNRQILPLSIKATQGNLKVKLVLNKGLWRLDHLALLKVESKVSPIEVLPYQVCISKKVSRKALGSLLTDNEYLISMPGDKYRIDFKLPDNSKNYELFLYSKGYYLEWMRKGWLKDKNLLKLRQMINAPRRYLKSSAPNYKLYESEMEATFWNSKIDHKIFSYYED